jgi:type II secretory pathway pseudopilin PulG
MKKVCSRSGGYTIVETLIFLAVSGMLLGSALLLVNGQQAKTEFTQAVREINSQVQDVLNDISTGYYSNPGGFTCTQNAVTLRPNIVPVSSAQGTNADCIFIGRVIAFGTSANPAQLNTFNVVGVRKTGLSATAPLVKNLTEARPATLLSPDTMTLPGGLRVGGMKYIDATGLIDPDLGAVGIFSTLAQSYGTSLAGSQKTEIRPYINDTRWDTQTIPSITSAIDTKSDTTPLSNGRIEICLLSAGTDQHAIITVGGTGKLTSRVEIFPDRICL